jgi:23S rRNA pseudouridine1911/1915/1917 synthase
MQLDIVMQNEHFIVINKPSGLLSVPDRKQSEINLKDILLQQFGVIYTVHRLDKDTSGVIVFAKNEDAHKQLNTLFENRETTKKYYGLVHGIVVPNSATIHAAIAEHPAKNGTMITHAKGKAAITDYEVVHQFKQFAWLHFNIYTGRTHQIRVHCKHIGHSIVSDSLYGDGNPLLLSTIKKKFHLGKKHDEEKPMLNRLALHAYQLGFTFNEQTFLLEAPIPKDLKATLTQLEKWGSN